MSEQFDWLHSLPRPHTTRSLRFILPYMSSACWCKKPAKSKRYKVSVWIANSPGFVESVNENDVDGRRTAEKFRKEECKKNCCFFLKNVIIYTFFNFYFLHKRPAENGGRAKRLCLRKHFIFRFPKHAGKGETWNMTKIFFFIILTFSLDWIDIYSPIVNSGGIQI